MSQLIVNPNTFAKATHRHWHWVSWLAFALFNTIITVIFLLVVWIFGIDSATVRSTFQELSQLFGLEKVWSIASFFGFSGMLLLWAYAWIWQKIYWKILAFYIIPISKK